MTEWDVVVTLGAILSILAVTLPPVIKLNTTITKLNATIERVVSDLSDIKNKNTDSHRRIWDKNEEQDRCLEDHELRINNLENRR